MIYSKSKVYHNPTPYWFLIVGVKWSIKAVIIKMIGMEQYMEIIWQRVRTLLW